MVAIITMGAITTAIGFVAGMLFTYFYLWDKLKRGLF